MFSSEETNNQEQGRVRGSWKERQRQEREQLIMHVAEKVLLEKGLRNTSMDEIAVGVGISKGTLYLHFAKKEDLVLALLEQELQARFAVLQEITTFNDSDVPEQLETIIRRIYQELLGRQLFYSLYDDLDLQYLLAKKREQSMGIFVAIRNRIRALLEAGKANGAFDTALPTEVMIGTFFTMISPRVYKHLVVDEGIAADVLAEHIATIYLKGIAAR